MMHTPQACRHLWQRVFLQALRDAIAEYKRPLSEHRAVRASARTWLDSNSADFQEVCSLAGYDPEMVNDWWRSLRKNKTAMRDVAAKFKDATRFQEAEKNE